MSRGKVHKKICKAPVDMISGNIACYSRWLNDRKRLKEIQDLNELTACVATISDDADKTKKRQNAETERLTKEREANKKQEEEERATKKLDLLPSLTTLMLPYIAGTQQDFTKLTNKQLNDVLKYYYDVNVKGISTMNKQQPITTTSESQGIIHLK
jgi:ribosomal protein L12E/L44/L45/RPP1/RPP2